MVDSVPRYPQFTPEVLTQPASYGVLRLLEGTWVNFNQTDGSPGWGLHTTCMPSPGTNSETIPGKFTFLCENYTEELTFELVPGGVRNRAGTNEQFCGVVKYDQIIHNQSGNLIHVENGMYLWLDQMYNHPADDDSIQNDIGFPELSAGAGANGPVFVPNYSISRSGTIPHGSTISLFGKHSDPPIEGAPRFPSGTAAWDFDHLSISKTMGGAGASAANPIDLDKPAPDWVRDTSLPVRDPSGNRTYTQRILAHELYPYSVRPDLRLRDAIKDQNIKKFILINLDTEAEEGPRGGIMNTPIISKYVPATRMQLRLWIEMVIENGMEVLQLQYEQIQHFEFHFGTDGGTTFWPHIQVNTLRRKG
jgi:hypothetical protein